jgi:23S rRNA (guanine745-N1)-methyltransferase
MHRFGLFLMQNKPQYRCPLCRLPLVGDTRGYSCDNNHQFDRAKEGYVNLLPVQNKSSKVPGDSKEMIMARRDFLATGAYDFLRQAIVDTVKSKGQVLIDVGCSEGYYTNQLCSQLPDFSVYGVDIAKAAIRYAAKRSQSAHFCVASNISLPFDDNFADVITKVFAPVDYQQISRVLKPEGLLLSVVPGPQHLIELKQHIYEFPKAHGSQPCPSGFTLISCQSLTQTVTLVSSTQIDNLCQMTPYAWKISEEKKQTLAQCDNFTVTFEFDLNLYQSN